MAFGFIGDIVEQVGEAILPRGTRGATISSALGFSPEFGANLTADIASGRKGQEAVSTPTLSQDPAGASESSYSGGGLIYAPMFTQQPAIRTAGFTPRLPSPTVRDIGTAGAGAMAETILDIQLPNFFGDDPCMKKMPKLVGMTKDGCPTVTRKQQRVLRQMAQYMPLESVAYEAGVDTTTMARLISKSFPPRARGISGAQLRTANRVNNKILSMAGKLGYNVTPKTKAQLGCK
jgi:hypothetical protein